MGGSVAAARLSPGGLAIYLGSRLLLAAAHLVNPGADISCWPAPRSAPDASIAVLQTSPAPAHSERRNQFYFGLEGALRRAERLKAFGSIFLSRASSLAFSAVILRDSSATMASCSLHNSSRDISFS